ncbi:MAG: peptidyl-prolyl cis-trans isomerase [Gammaproteobacteria bacterium]|nr:peptidyl-prolyl cis-trans isomerase [Gammaproteobacteria bacterium]
MFKRSTLVALVSAVIAGASLTSHAATDPVVAVVNGQNVTQSQYITYVRSETPNSNLNLNDPAVQNQLFDTFLKREILFQEAQAKKVDQDPGVIAVLEEQRRAVITKALVGQLLQANPIKEEQVKAFYDKEVAGKSTQEYKVRHIHVESEDAAKTTIARLNKGEAFSKLAKEVSKDASATNGGELGWLQPEALPAPVATAIKNTPAKQYTRTAIKTDNGWHIMMVDETRPLTPPPFDSIHDRIAGMLQGQLIDNYVNSLSQKAKVEIKLPTKDAAKPN